MAKKLNRIIKLIEKGAKEAKSAPLQPMGQFDIW